MTTLSYIFYKYRVLFVFVLLEFVSIQILLSFQNYQNEVFFLKGEKWMKSMTSILPNIRKIYQLESENEKLRAENSSLKKKQSINKEQKYSLYNYTPAVIIEQSLYFTNNYMIIDKGEKDGLLPGMGIINYDGVVGEVKFCSDDFSLVNSFLHSKTLISSKIRRTGVLCTVTWQIKNIKKGNILFLPIHESIQIGDTIVTSGYNSIFPPDTPIGVVDKIEKQMKRGNQDIGISLLVDFSSLSSVYVVKHIYKKEIQTLKQQIDN